MIFILNFEIVDKVIGSRQLRFYQRSLKIGASLEAASLKYLFGLICCSMSYPLNICFVYNLIIIILIFSVVSNNWCLQYLDSQIILLVKVR